MFDRIYQRQSVLAKHRDGPWADERARFLQHLAAEGRAPNTLMQIAAILLAMARQFDGRIIGHVAADDIARAVDAWLDSSAAPFGAAYRRVIARTAAIFHTTAWLRYLHRYAEPAAPVIPGADLLADLLVTLRDERGFSAATLDNHQRTLRLFLAWLADQHRPLADATLSDVSNYFATKSDRWSRTTIACHVQSLRTFFRYAAQRGRCRAGIGDTIDAPHASTRTSACRKDRPGAKSSSSWRRRAAARRPPYAITRSCSCTRCMGFDRVKCAGSGSTISIGKAKSSVLHGRSSAESASTRWCERSVTPFCGTSDTHGRRARAGPCS